MLRFTLLRVGRKKTTDYRIVVREKRSGPRSQKYIESVGTYNTKTKKLALHRERILYWLSQGVQPSGTVHNMFVNEKILSGPKMAVTPHTRPQAPVAQSAESKEVTTAPASVEKEMSSSSDSKEAVQESDKKPEAEE